MAYADLAWLAPHNDAFRIKSQMRCTAFAIGRENRGSVAVAQIHEFEKRVGLFGFEVQVAKLVHRQDIVAPETIEQP
jgi:hypothetical protein